MTCAAAPHRGPDREARIIGWTEASRQAPLVRPRHIGLELELFEEKTFSQQNTGVTDNIYEAALLFN